MDALASMVSTSSCAGATHQERIKVSQRDGVQHFAVAVGRVVYDRKLIDTIQGLQLDQELVVLRVHVVCIRSEIRR